tara:strand:- start:526 stop:891 length:366 start_codon:yes stop_codon:yes gene_type:complete
MSYDNPLTITYQVQAATVSTAATLIRGVGPKGLKGRLVDIGFVTTTATTDAATELRVGTVADPDKYGILSVPVQSAAAVTNGASKYTTTSNLIPADTYFALASDGASTAGAGTILVTIDWF